METTNTLTCVYTINDKEAFADEQARIQKNFKSSDGEPWAITAMSIGHELHRLALVEEAHDQGKYELLDDIFGLIDPTEINDISELEDI